MQNRIVIRKKSCNFVPEIENNTLMSTQMMNQKIADYFKTQPIVRAWLFGSFARGEETPISDVDILVQFDEDGVSLLKHAAMICELEKILDRPVDIVEDGTLRPRDFAIHRPYCRGNRGVVSITNTNNDMSG